MFMVWLPVRRGLEIYTRSGDAGMVTQDNDRGFKGENPMSLTAGPLTPGDLFQGLRIHSLLGRGAMGWAYLGSHDALRIPVIVKIFRPIGADPLAEAHLAARVASPHVVGVLDAGMSAAMPYVVQRYVDGVDLQETLEHRVALGRTIPLPTLARLAADLMRGLAAIHMAGVVHRDIKPSNVFLAGSGEAVIGDFGIAIEGARTQDAGQVAGTPSFMAPELWDGAPAGPAADLYAAGATIHQLWQGHPPFLSAELPALGMAHATQPYLPPPAYDPLSAYLGAVLARLLEKLPHNRYPSAAAAERSLRPIAGSVSRVVATSLVAATAGNVQIQLSVGDLTRSECDVLVSATNAWLVMDTGVSAALRRAGGDEIQREALERRPATMGSVVWTGAGRLRVKAVAHAVAALDGAVCIQRCVLRTLFGVEQRRFRSVAFPALGTGVGAVPQALAAKLTLEAVRSFSSLAPDACRRVEIVLFDQRVCDIWAEVMAAMQDGNLPERGGFAQMESASEGTTQLV